MNTKIIIASLLLLLSIESKSQSRKERMEKVFSTAVYPVMKSHKYMGVVAYDSTLLTFDKDQKLKLAIDFVYNEEDSTKLSMGVIDIGRTYNLHVVNGIAPENLHVAVVVHGGGLNAFLDNATFQKKFGMPNPNIPIIEELAKNGVEFYVCSQSMAFNEYVAADIVPELKIALSAKTSLTLLQQQGYSLLLFD